MSMAEVKEQFRQDMIKWLEHEDHNGDFCDSESIAQGGRLITPEDGVQIATDWAKYDVDNRIRDGQVPATVRSFSELHDYMDANGLGGAFDWPCLPSEERGDGYQEEFTRFWNKVQNNVNDWLKAGRPAH